MAVRMEVPPLIRIRKKAAKSVSRPHKNALTMTKEVRLWCNENLAHHWWLVHKNAGLDIAFVDEGDAALFKLAWV